MSRLHLLALSALIVFLAAVTAAVEKPGPSDWPVFRGNPLQTAVAGTELGDPLKQRWKVHLGGDIEGTAAVVGDTVLVGSADETLYCLSKEGKELWQFKIAGGPVLGTPAVIGERTFVAGCDSSLHVIDTATGKEQNAVDLGGQVGASVAVAGDQLYVGTMT